MKFSPTTVCVVPSLLATGLTPGAATADVISATSGGGVIQKSLALHPRASVVRKRRAFFDFYRSTCRYNQLEAAMGKASTMKRWAAACRMGILLLIWAWGSAGALTISSVGGLKSGNAFPYFWVGATGSACAYSATDSGANGTGKKNGGLVAAPPACQFKDDKGIARGGIGDLNIPKGRTLPKTPADEWESDSRGGATTAHGDGKFLLLVDGTSAMKVNAKVVIGKAATDDPTGVAAGYADDPDTIAAGSYHYGIELDELRLQIEGLTPGDHANAGLEFSATASFVGTGPLWLLRLELDESGLLDVDFHSGAALGLNDANVRSGLLAALQPVAGLGVQLSSPYRLFDTSFSSTTDFVYGEYSRSHAEGAVVSEPSGLWLALTALGLLARWGPPLRPLIAAAPGEKGTLPFC